MYWRNVDDKLPGLGRFVLCYDTSTDSISVGKLVQENPRYWKIRIPEGKKYILVPSVTHWMPLPIPPLVGLDDAIERAMKRMLGNA